LQEITIFTIGYLVLSSHDKQKSKFAFIPILSYIYFSLLYSSPSLSLLANSRFYV